MQRDEFINRLDRLLGNMPQAERQDILDDYSEHIRLAVDNGLEEETVIASLGEPETIAKQYRVQKYIDRAERSGTTSSVLRAILATVGLGFFNLVFILGPFLAILGILFALIAVSVSVAVVGAGFVLGGIFPQLIDGINFHAMAAEVQGSITAGMLFGGVGTICLGALMSMGTVVLIKGFLTVTIKYLRLNINIIRGSN